MARENRGGSRMYCFRCYGQMVKVTIVDKRKREHDAIVCTECGRFYSKDPFFKRVGCRQ